jgi:GDP/UDP-N,N'-diacetylbacillosamine 2-epimerase (hydrolysing)
MRKVCLFTSTRADWGLLRGLAEKIRDDVSLELMLIVSGSHLSRAHGMTVCEIRNEGFGEFEEVDILKFDDDETGVCRTMGLALSSYGQTLRRLSPDILTVLGDRYETFCIVAAAQILKIPVAHLHGGETTEGAIDEAFRHSITKMSHLHFPSADLYRNRIVQMGESPERVFNVGALGIQNIRKLKLWTKQQLSRSLGFDFDRPYFLVTFHPVTLERSTATEQIEQLLLALNHFPDHKVVFTKANADSGGTEINRCMDRYAEINPGRCLSVFSLGHLRYLSAVAHCEAVVGNSSSGILEAPVLNVPTVNIGDRQKGRLRVDSILDCSPALGEIIKALTLAISPAFRRKISGCKHPAEKPETAERIAETLRFHNLDGILKKNFHDL